MLSSVIEEKIYRNGFYIGGRLSEFLSFKAGKFIQPSKTYFSEIASKQTNPVTYTCSGVNKTIYPFENVLYKEYDIFGNINYIVHNDLTNIVYIWSYNGQYPVAEISNATYAQVNTALANLGLTSIDALSQTLTPNIDKLRELRIALPDALVTVYSYQPLVGILTSTSPQGIITYYSYDSFGHLKETYLMENGVKKVLQTYDYHYKNQ